MKQGRFNEHQSTHPLSTPVGCCPGRYKEGHRLTCSPGALPEDLFRFVARTRMAAPGPAPRYIYSGFTFVPEVVEHMERDLAR